MLLTTRQSEGQLLSILQPLERDRNRVNSRLKQIGFTDAMLSQLVRSGKVGNTLAARAQRTCVVKEVMALCYLLGYQFSVAVGLLRWRVWPQSLAG